MYFSIVVFIPNTYNLPAYWFSTDRVILLSQFLLLFCEFFDSIVANEIFAFTNDFFISPETITYDKISALVLSLILWFQRTKWSLWRLDCHFKSHYIVSY
jgi:hypothetical protein